MPYVTTYVTYDDKPSAADADERSTAVDAGDVEVPAAKRANVDAPEDAVASAKDMQGQLQEAHRAGQATPTKSRAANGMVSLETTPMQTLSTDWLTKAKTTLTMWLSKMSSPTSSITGGIFLTKPK